MNRLQEKYNETVKPSLMKEYNYSSVMECPKLVKVVINMGVGDAIGHFWGKLNTWSKVATVGLAGLGGYYAYIQARSIYLTLKGFVTELKDAVDQYKADKQAAQEADQQNCLPTLVALC